MAKLDMEAKVKEVVNDYWKTANIKNIDIHSRLLEFANGSLYFVSITDANDAEHENYVYVEGQRILRFDNLRELVTSVGKVRMTFGEALQVLAEWAGIAGVIALIITVTICALVLSHGDNYKVPEILSNGLAAILGFYFGTTSQRKTGQAVEEKA